jgi:hypothetical protein
MIPEYKPAESQHLPVYRLSLNDDPDTGVEFVALVDDPAIQKNFIAFNTQKRSNMAFKATDMEQHVISGPLMIADMCMLREDPVHGPHYVYFDANTIRQVVLRFFRKGLTSNVNLMHMHESRPDGIYMFESFIIDPVRGLYAPQGFDAIPAGSWFGSYKVDNTQIWDHFIKTGEFKGFSVEGFFMYDEKLSKEEKQVKEIMNMIAGIE